MQLFQHQALKFLTARFYCVFEKLVDGFAIIINLLILESVVNLSVCFRILKNIGMQQVGRNYYHIDHPISIDKFK